MRILLLAAWLAAFVHPLVARDVSFQRIEADLGQELGFFVYRAETEIDDDEVFIVIETITEASGEQRRFVNWWVGNQGPKARYSVRSSTAACSSPIRCTTCSVTGAIGARSKVPPCGSPA